MVGKRKHRPRRGLGGWSVRINTRSGYASQWNGGWHPSPPPSHHNTTHTTVAPRPYLASLLPNGVRGGRVLQHLQDFVAILVDVLGDNITAGGGGHVLDDDQGLQDNLRCGWGEGGTGGCRGRRRETSPSCSSSSRPTTSRHTPPPRTSTSTAGTDLWVGVLQACIQAGAHHCRVQGLARTGEAVQLLLGGHASHATRGGDLSTTGSREGGGRGHQQLCMGHGQSLLHHRVGGGWGREQTQGGRKAVPNVHKCTIRKHTSTTKPFSNEPSEAGAATAAVAAAPYVAAPAAPYVAAPAALYGDAPYEVVGAEAVAVVAGRAPYELP
jgi:hypothetical protein